MHRHTRRLRTCLLALSCAALVTPLALADAPEDAEDDLQVAASMMNVGAYLERTATMDRLDFAEGNETGEIACGKGCGACSSKVTCKEGFQAACACKETGEKCSWGPWKRSEFVCACECVGSPARPPTGVCIGPVCITTNSTSERTAAEEVKA